jgi:hypothetical protein
MRPFFIQKQVDLRNLTAFITEAVQRDGEIQREHGGSKGRYF